MTSVPSLAKATKTETYEELSSHAKVVVAAGTEMILTEEALVLGISKAASSGSHIAAGSAWESVGGGYWCS
ncbi:hypothetical protein YC2023_123269 [Brassica napus]